MGFQVNMSTTRADTPSPSRLSAAFRAFRASATMMPLAMIVTSTPGRRILPLPISKVLPGA